MSRNRSSGLVIYLGGPFPTRSSGLPSGVVLTHRASNPDDVGILDLATRKTCGTASYPAVRWALTPPFHPYLRMKAVIFCHVTPESP